MNNEHYQDPQIMEKYENSMKELAQEFNKVNGDVTTPDTSKEPNSSSIGELAQKEEEFAQAVREAAASIDDQDLEAINPQKVIEDMNLDNMTMVELTTMKNHTAKKRQEMFEMKTALTDIMAEVKSFYEPGKLAKEMDAELSSENEMIQANMEDTLSEMAEDKDYQTFVASCDQNMKAYDVILAAIENAIKLKEKDVATPVGSRNDVKTAALRFLDKAEEANYANKNSAKVFSKMAEAYDDSCDFGYLKQRPANLPAKLKWVKALVQDIYKKGIEPSKVIMDAVSVYGNEFANLKDLKAEEMQDNRAVFIGVLVNTMDDVIDQSPVINFINIKTDDDKAKFAALVIAVLCNDWTEVCVRSTKRQTGNGSYVRALTQLLLDVGHGTFNGDREVAVRAAETIKDILTAYAEYVITDGYLTNIKINKAETIKDILTAYTEYVIANDYLANIKISK